MNTFMKVFLAGLIAIFLNACGGSSGGGETTPPPTTELPPATLVPPTDGGTPTPPDNVTPVPPTDDEPTTTLKYIRVVSDGNPRVGIGGKLQFSIMVGYTKGDDLIYEDEVTHSTAWTSSNTAVATIDSNGVLTGKSEGSVTVTANYKGFTNTSTAYDIIEAYVSSLIVTPSMATIIVGDSVLLNVKGEKTDGTIVPINVSDWRTSNDAIATVDYDGVVEGVAAGTVTITARSNTDSYGYIAKGEAKITVKK